MKNKKHLIIISIVLATVILLAGSVFGYRYYNLKKTTQNKSETKNTAENQGKTTEKTDNSVQQITPVQTIPSTTTTETASTLKELTGVSLTCYLYRDQSVAADGTTTMPAGSIVPTFYTQSGTYTIQKMENGAWKDVITNQAYPGHGGITAWFVGPTEDNISYRVLGVEAGKPASASKTFTVKRSDLTNGYATYN